MLEYAHKPRGKSGFHWSRVTWTHPLSAEGMMKTQEIAVIFPGMIFTGCVSIIEASTSRRIKREERTWQHDITWMVSSRRGLSLSSRWATKRVNETTKNGKRKKESVGVACDTKQTKTSIEIVHGRRCISSSLAIIFSTQANRKLK